MVLVVRLRKRSKPAVLRWLAQGQRLRPDGIQGGRTATTSAFCGCKRHGGKPCCDGTHETAVAPMKIDDVSLTIFTWDGIPGDESTITGPLASGNSQPGAAAHPH